MIQHTPRLIPIPSQLIQPRRNARLGDRQDAPVPPSIVHPEGQGAEGHEEQHGAVDAVARGVADGGLVRLVDPDARDLAEPGPDADVQRDRQPDRRRAPHVRRQPPQHRRDARERPRRPHDQAPVPAPVLVRRQHRRDQEPEGAHGRRARARVRARVEVVPGPGDEDLTDWGGRERRFVSSSLPMVGKEGGNRVGKFNDLRVFFAYRMQRPREVLSSVVPEGRSIRDQRRWMA